MKSDLELTNDILQKYEIRRRRRRKVATSCVSAGLSLVLVCGIGYAALFPRTYNLGTDVKFTPSNRTKLISSKAEAQADVEYPFDEEEAFFAYRQFGGNVFAACNTEENTLFSPLSLYLALAIVTEGAAGETREQLYSLMGLRDDTLRNFSLYLYQRYSKEGNFSAIMDLANSIWYREASALSLNTAFLNYNAEYFGADIYASDFSSKTVSDMNGWVKAKTHGMITKVVEKILPEVQMYLLNTVVMEADWSSKWESYASGSFTSLSGKYSNADVLKRTKTWYYDSGNALAFSYQLTGSMAFMGVLPNGGYESYTLDGNELEALFAGKKAGYFDEETCRNYAYEVHCTLPKFSYSSEISLKEPLQSLGVTDAFAESANFSNMATYTGEGALVLSDVSQKTRIEVTKDGVRAAAVTQIDWGATSAEPPVILEEVYITLDRPFYYMIYDTATNLPVFIGSVTEL